MNFKETTMTTTQEIQGEVLNAVRKGQETVVDAVKQWADAVQAITPSIPVPNLPYAGKLPTPGQLVASAYDFAEQLLASQRKFAENVLDAAKPLLPGQPAASTASPASPAGSKASTSSTRSTGSKPSGAK
jgi:hypothetical protein